jgi:CDP-diacylglycerol--glycerol-3-phosphate 3-phosphatidyltransferase
MTLHDLKPRFQALLRPLARWIFDIGGTANVVTAASAVVSVLLGLALAIFGPHTRLLFLALPLWLFVRLTMNAIDGMLAREFGQTSRIGAYLNEICDVISDAALTLPFALVAPLSAPLVVVIVVLACLTEFAGALGPMVGAARRYDGPMGKSDRALVFGLLGTWFGLAGSLPNWVAWAMPVLAALLMLTIVNRVRAGLNDAEPRHTP